MPKKTNNIQFGGSPDYEDFDAVAGAAIEPGMLVEATGVDADGVVTVQPHSTDGEAPQTPLFADIVPYSGDQEDDTLGPVDDAYAAGDYLKVVGAQRFNRINALLASGTDLQDGGTTADESQDANVTEYENLTSAGDGTLRGTGVVAGTTFVHSREAVDNSAAAAGETARLIIEVQ